MQDGVYEQLRHALMWGKFEPLQAITILSLASEFGTSHMPVREALRRLAAENGLEIARNGSAQVPAVSRFRLHDLCRARIELEGLATEIASSKITPAEIEKCELLAKEHEAIGREGNVYAMLQKNQEFHFAIYRIAESEVLLQLIEVLWLRFGPYMRLLSNFVEGQFGQGVVHPFSSYHYQMIEAFRSADSPRAREMLVRDIDATQVLLMDLCPQ
jgi:DNA-binding GntR family transcriptional regulator